MKSSKKINLPMQGKAILRKGSSSSYAGNVMASKDCGVCCSLSANCPGCSCSMP
ncbi:MAG: hypothetical protein ACRBFS_17105 [Aureispira sp.]